MIEESFPHARRVGVVSDTHLRSTARPYPNALLQGLQGVDLILHAGDLTVLAALEPLQRIAPVIAVAGNVDEPAVRAALPERRLVRAGAYRIGLVHGDRGTGRTTVERALNAFSFVPLDAIVFGHTHAPLCEEHNGILLFNPGSPTDRRLQAEFSFGILHLEDRLWGEVLRFR